VSEPQTKPNEMAMTFKSRSRFGNIVKIWGQKKDGAG
jgi:hypothetical protein